MVRVLTVVARGWADGPARRSTTSDGTPCRARVAAAARPAGPAPAIRTGTSYGEGAGNAGPRFIGHSVFRATLCIPSDDLSSESLRCVHGAPATHLRAAPARRVGGGDAGADPRRVPRPAARAARRQHQHRPGGEARP